MSSSTPSEPSRSPIIIRKNPYKRQRVESLNNNNNNIESQGNSTSGRNQNHQSNSTEEASAHKGRPTTTVRENPYKQRKKPKPEEASSSGNENAPSTAAPAPEVKSSSGEASALVIAATDKAGMEGIDRARIDAIILRESGNSLYIQQQRKRDEKVDQRIRVKQQQLQQHEAAHPHWRRKVLPGIDQQMAEWISQRPKRSVCVVVDMDMFYMACELLTRPDLVDRPAVVGGGMILTSNYTARRYGVRSAMAGWIGDALVRELSGGKEELVHVKSNFPLYTSKSQLVRQALAEYDPTFLRAYSLDECYLHLGPYLALKLTHSDWSHERIRDHLQQRRKQTNFLEGESSADPGEHAGDGQGVVQTSHQNEEEEEDSESNSCSSARPGEDEDSPSDFSYEMVLNSFEPAVCLEVAGKVLAEMRGLVKKRTGGLTCSAGLAPNFLLAKIASDRHKPDGQCLVGSSQESVQAFLHPLAVRKVSGIGRVTEKTLKAFDIHTVQQLYEQRAVVHQFFTPVQATNLLKASVGCSSSDGKVMEEEESASNDAGQKGISRERTFRAGKSWAEINTKLEDIAHLLASDMKRKDIWAHTITVKVKLHTFDVFSRAKSLDHGVFVQDGGTIARYAAEILAKIRSEYQEKTKAKDFSVRLLGIRCSNFRDEQAKASDAKQMNIDSFLQEPTVNENKNRSPYSKHSKEACLPTKEKRLSPAKLPTTEEEEEPSVPLVECPVCGKSYPETENVALNQHIDACLSGSVVRQAVREESKVSKSSTNPGVQRRRRESKQRLTDYFSLANGKSS